MIDYYEFLQISPNAELETIHRVYKYLAARYHPDNPASGNPEHFRLLNAAYEVLSDERRRAEYDAARSRLAYEPLSASVDFMDSLEGEMNRRLAVLAVLYQRRRASPTFPEASLIEIEERMGFPRDYLDFTLWYLQKKGYAAKTDSGQYALTADGVDFVETQRGGIPKLQKMLTSGEASAPAEMAPEQEETEEWPKKFERRVGRPDLRAVKTDRRAAPKGRRAN